MTHAARLLGLAGLVALAAAGTLLLGANRLPPGEVLAALAGSGDERTRSIVLELRLPRAVLALLIGASLGATGAAYQALFRNPLADPFAVGSSSGASAGAALAVAAGGALSVGALGPVSVGAFLGSLLAVGTVYAVAAAGRMPPVSLLLVGAVVSSILGAVVWLVMAFSDESLAKIVYWLMGGLNGRGWDATRVAAGPLLLGVFALWALARPLDALAAGDDVARALGLPVAGVTLAALAAGSLAVAAGVAAGGVIGFVGLIAPHAARPIVGAAHARLIPAAALVGALLLLAADAAARSLVPPLELPIGVVTAVVGGPAFLAILVSRSRRATA